MDAAEPTEVANPAEDPDRYPYATWGPLVAVALTVPFLLLALASLGGTDESSEELSTGVAIGAQIVQGFFFLFIPAMVAIGSATYRPVAGLLGRLGFKSTRPLTALKWFGIGLLGYYVFLVLTVVIFGTPEQDDIADSFGPLWTQVLLIAILAPISEEVFFRGMVFAGLRKRMPMLAAALISGAIFGLLHVNTGPSAVLPLIGFGAVLAIVYEKTESIWPAIALHAFNNAIVLISLNS